MNQDQLSYYLYRLAGALAPHIPPRLGYRLAERAGSVVYQRAASRRIVQENVSHVVGEPAESPRVQDIVRRIFCNQAKNYYDFFRLAALSPQEIKRSVREIQGLTHLEHALAHGRGVIVVSAHFGNIDLAGQIPALLGYRVTAVAEHLRPERLFQYICRVRERHGLRFIPIDGSLRPVFRALQANEIVGLALDRNVTDSGRLVEFFGQPARLPDGYLRLALRTQAALIVAFCRRLSDNTFSISIEPEIELRLEGDPAEHIEVNLRQVLSIFETYLRRYPDQWVYFQPVWSPQAEDKRIAG